MIRKRTTINILVLLIVLLSIFQALAYIAAIDKPAADEKGFYAVAWYVGFNLPLILACILYLVVISIKRKSRKKEPLKPDDSIGRIY